MNNKSDLTPPIIDAPQFFTLQVNESIKSSKTSTDNRKLSSSDNSELAINEFDSIAIRPSLNVHMHISYQETTEINENTEQTPSKIYNNMNSNDKKDQLQFFEDPILEKKSVINNSINIENEPIGQVFLEVEQKSIGSQERKEQKRGKIRDCILFSFILLLIMSGFLLLFQFCFLFYVNPVSKSQIELFEYVKKNLQSEVITHIMINKECPNGFETVNLFEWKGTNQGCYSIHKKDLTSKEDCINYGSNSEITDYLFIEKTEPTYLKNWKNSVICIKKSKFTMVEPENNCLKGYKKCLMRYCIVDEHECPINSIYISNNQLPPINHDLIYSKDDYNVFIGRINNYYEPYIELKVYHNQPCYEKNKNPFRVNSYHYPLMKTNEDSCPFGNDFINTGNLGVGKFIDQVKEINFYQDNYFDQIRGLPFFYNNISDNFIYLHGIKKFQINYKDQCINFGFNNDNFILIENYPEKIIFNVFLITGICLILNLLALVYILSVAIVKEFVLFNKFKRCLKENKIIGHLIQNEKIYNPIVTFLLIIESMFLVFNLFYLEYGAGYTERISTYIDNFENNYNNKCLTDDTLNSQLGIIHYDSIKYLKHVCRCCLILFIIHMIIFNVYVLYNIIKRCFFREILDKNAS